MLGDADTTRSVINKTRDLQATFFGQVMRREKLQHFVTTFLIEGKRSKGQQRDQMLDRLTKLLKVG